MIESCQQANIEYVVAPYEADAQLAYLCKAGLCDAVITEDSDLLVFGCKRLIYKMDAFGNGQEVRLEYIHADLSPSKINLHNWPFEKFRQMCILAGCDYLPSVGGVGLTVAWKYLLNYGDARQAIEAMRCSSLDVPPSYEDEFIKAERTFMHQLVYDPIEQKLAPLLPYPKGCDASHFPQAGATFSPDLAKGIATGEIDPITKAPFPSRTSKSSAGAGGSAAANGCDAGGGGSGGFSGTRKKRAVIKLNQYVVAPSGDPTGGAAVTRIDRFVTKTKRALTPSSEDPRKFSAPRESVKGSSSGGGGGGSTTMGTSRSASPFSSGGGGVGMVFNPLARPKVNLKKRRVQDEPEPIVETRSKYFKGLDSGSSAVGAAAAGGSGSDVDADNGDGDGDGDGERAGSGVGGAGGYSRPASAQPASAQPAASFRPSGLYKRNRAGSVGGKISMSPLMLMQTEFARKPSTAGRAHGPASGSSCDGGSSGGSSTGTSGGAAEVGASAGAVGGGRAQLDNKQAPALRLGLSRRHSGSTLGTSSKLTNKQTTQTSLLDLSRFAAKSKRKGTMQHTSAAAARAGANPGKVVNGAKGGTSLKFGETPT